MERLSLSDLSIKNHNVFLRNGPFHFSAAYGASRGFGSCTTKELALKKAVNELIERLCFRETSRSLGASTSNGYATHNTIESSCLSSTAEVIERDASLSCWLLKLPPHWLSKESLPDDLPSSFKNFLTSLNDYDMSIQIGVLGQTGPFFTVCSVLLDSHPNKRFGLIYSSSSNKKLTLAIQSTILELSRGAEMLLSRLSKMRKIYTPISPKSVRSSSNHLEYYLNPKSLDEAKWFFEQSPKVRNLPFHETHSISLKPPFQISWPTHVTYSQCSSYQNLYFGKVENRFINFARLKEIAHARSEGINSGIHFLP